MAPSDMHLARSLIVVAWRQCQGPPDPDVVEGVAWAFGANDREREEMKNFARQPRTLEKDLPIVELSPEERELLLANAVLLTYAEGEPTEQAREAIVELVGVLGIDTQHAVEIVSSTRQHVQAHPTLE